MYFNFISYLLHMNKLMYNLEVNIHVRYLGVRERTENPEVMHNVVGGCAVHPYNVGSPTFLSLE